MYGTDPQNPLVRYYDETFAVTSSGDIDWFVERAKERGGPVLDLACGTGRISLALAEAGFDVTAIDSSSAMLNRLRARLADQPEAIRRRVRILEGEMHAFLAPDRFRSILCCDAFFHNLTVEHQVGCLRQVAAHLAPGGRFVFNLPNPSVDFLSRVSKPEGQTFQKRAEYPLGDSGATVLVEQANEADLEQQTITTRLRFTQHDRDGKVTENSESLWRTRFTFRQELAHLLARCGFEVMTLEGNYRGEPVKEGSQLVVVASLGQHSEQ